MHIMSNLLTIFNVSYDMLRVDHCGSNGDDEATVDRPTAGCTRHCDRRK